MYWEVLGLLQMVNETKKGTQGALLAQKDSLQATA